MDKKLLSSAIDNHALLSSAQKKVLKTLLYLSVDGTVAVTAKYLERHCKICLNTVYFSLIKLQKDGYITQFGTTPRKKAFSLSLSKLEYLQKANQAQEILERSFYEVS